MSPDLPDFKTGSMRFQVVDLTEQRVVIRHPLIEETDDTGLVDGFVS